MSVKLSLVGFGVNLFPVELNGSPSATVQTVLDGFVQQSPFPFGYESEPSRFRKGVNLVYSMYYMYYFLKSEFAVTPGQTEQVWQFYVLDGNGMPIPNATRIPYDQFPIQDGYTVIWRLVVVIKQPIQKTKRVRNNTTPEQADFQFHNC